MNITYKLMTAACTQNYHKRILVMKSFSGEKRFLFLLSISTLITLLISYHKDNTILAILEHDTEKRTSLIFLQEVYQSAEWV